MSDSDYTLSAKTQRELARKLAAVRDRQERVLREVRERIAQSSR